MTIYMEPATEADYNYLAQYDLHMPQHRLMAKITAGEIYMIRLFDDINDSISVNIGWLRYGWFWDNTPFMNLLWIDESSRGQGIGKQVVQYWEQRMVELGYSTVMTSTQSDEDAQHFYRKLGYKDVGALMQEGAAMEILFAKTLQVE